MAGFFMRGRMAGMNQNNSNDPESWRQRPWAIALLILLAVAFGGELTLGIAPLAVLSTGFLLIGWTVLLVMSLRRKQP